MERLGFLLFINFFLYGFSFIISFFFFFGVRYTF